MIKDNLRNSTRLDADTEANENNSSIIRSEQHWNYGKNLSFTNEDEYNEKQEQKKNQWKLLREQNPPSATTDIHIKTDGFFCEAPSKCTFLFASDIKSNIVSDPEYAHFVVQRINHNITDTLFDLNGMLAMCELETRLTETPYYDVLCESQVSSTRCCRPWSLPNYVALLTNRTTCFDIEVSITL